MTVERHNVTPALYGGQRERRAERSSFPRRRPLLVLTFLTFAAIVLLNLNGVAAMAMRWNQAFSFLLLLLCGILLVSAKPWPRRDLGMLGMVFYLFLSVYVAIGILMNRFVSGTHEFLDHLYMLSVAALTIYVSAFSASRISLAYSVQFVLRMIGWLSFGVVLSIFVGILAPELYDVLPRRTAERHSGFFANPNDAGIAAATSAVFLLAAMQQARHKGVYFAAIALCGIAALFTYSRTAMLVYFAVVVVAAVAGTIGQQNHRPNRHTWPAVLVAGIVAAGFLTLLFGGAKFLAQANTDSARRLEETRSLLSGDIRQATLQSRWELYEHGYERWLASPVVGNGLGVGTRLPRDVGPRLGTHNLWLLVLVDAGILPAVLLASFGLCWLRAAWRCRHPSVRVAALGFFAVFFLTSLATHTTLTKRNENLALGVILGLIAAVAEVEQYQRRDLARNRLAAKCREI